MTRLGVMRWEVGELVLGFWLNEMCVIWFGRDRYIYMYGVSVESCYN